MKVKGVYGSIPDQKGVYGSIPDQTIHDTKREPVD